MSKHGSSDCRGGGFKHGSPELESLQTVLVNFTWKLFFANCACNLPKLVHLIKLYFGDNLKLVSIQINCNIEKSAKKPFKIFRVFSVTAYLHVFIQHIMPLIP